MKKETHFVLRRGTPLSQEEIAMIEAAKHRLPVHDEENSPIDPLSSPVQYHALMKAVAERNRRISRQK